MGEPTQNGASDGLWDEHPDLEKMRNMTDGEIKDFLIRENIRFRKALQKVCNWKTEGYEQAVARYALDGRS